MVSAGGSAGFASCFHDGCGAISGGRIGPPVRAGRAISAGGACCIAGPDGSLHPLVRTERLLNPGGRWEVPDRPTNWLLGYLLVGLVAGVGLALLGSTRGFLPLATLLVLLMGLAAGLLTYI